MVVPLSESTSALSTIIELLMRGLREGMAERLPSEDPPFYKKRQGRGRMTFTQKWNITENSSKRLAFMSVFLTAVSANRPSQTIISPISIFWWPKRYWQWMSKKEYNSPNRKCLHSPVYNNRIVLLIFLPKPILSLFVSLLLLTSLTVITKISPFTIIYHFWSIPAKYLEILIALRAYKVNTSVAPVKDLSWI